MFPQGRPYPYPLLNTLHFHRRRLRASLGSLSHGCLNGYKRRNGMVMKEHDNIRGVYEPYLSGTEYINSVLRDDKVFQKDLYVRKLSEWFETHDHPDFPLMGPASRTVISFQDAWVDASNPKTLFWDPIIHVRRV